MNRLAVWSTTTVAVPISARTSRTTKSTMLGVSLTVICPMRQKCSCYIASSCGLTLRCKEVRSCLVVTVESSSKARMDNGTGIGEIVMTTAWTSHK